MPENNTMQLTPTENLKRLHDNLSKKDGFSVPYDVFEKDMQDEAKLQKLHQNLTSKDGFTVPYERFKYDMFSQQAQQPTQTQDSVNPAIIPDAAQYKDFGNPELQKIEPPSEFDVKINQVENLPTDGWGESEKKSLAVNMLKRSQRQANAVAGKGNTGVGDALRDRNFWTLGASDLSAMIYLKKIAGKMDRGEQLTEADKVLLDAWHTNEQIQQSDPLSEAKRGYQVGKQVTDMVPWLAQFAATRGVGTAGRKAVEASLRKGAEKYLGKTLGKFAAKGAAEAGGAYAAASLMPQTYADITERSLGDTQQGPNGNISFNKETADKPLEAVYKGWTNSAIEVLTERVGEILAPFVKLPKMNLAGKVAGETGEKAAQAFGEFTKAVGWNGAPMEYFEEWINIPMNALLVGDSKYSDMFDGDQQLTTFLTVVAMGGAMGTAQTAMIKAGNAIDKAEAEKDFQAVKSIYETEIDEDVRTKVNSVLDNDELSIEDQAKQLHSYLKQLDDPEQGGIIFSYITQKYKNDGVTGDPMEVKLDPRQTFEAQVRQDAGQIADNNGNITTIQGFDGNQYYVKDVIPSPKGETYLVHNPEGGKPIPMGGDKINGKPVTIPADDYITNFMQQYDQKQQVSDEMQEIIVMYEGKPYFDYGLSDIGRGLQPAVQDEHGHWVAADENVLPVDEELFQESQKQQQTQQAVDEVTEEQAAVTGEEPKQRVVNTVPIGKTEYKVVQEDDGSFNFILDEGIDPAKAEKEIRGTLPKDQQNRIQVVQKEVTTPAAFPWLEPTTQMVTTGITILPKNVAPVVDNSVNNLTPATEIVAENKNISENKNEKLTETTEQQPVNEQTKNLVEPESLPKNETSEKENEISSQKVEPEQEIEAESEQEAMKRVNPMLYKLAQKANTVDEFIELVAKSSNSGVKDINDTNLREWYPRVQKPKAEQPNPTPNEKPSDNLADSKEVVGEDGKNSDNSREEADKVVLGESEQQPELETEITAAGKTPQTVRELADLEAGEQNGLISGVVLSALNMSDTFKVGRDKVYTVTKKTKPNKVTYDREKYSGQYERTTVTITDNKGKKYTYELWDNWIQNGKKMVSRIATKGQTRNADPVGGLSRDIEGDINLDLLNEYNQFHEKTDSYKIIERELKRINAEQPKLDKKSDVLDKDLDKDKPEQAESKGETPTKKPAVKLSSVLSKIKKAETDEQLSEAAKLFSSIPFEQQQKNLSQYNQAVKKQREKIDRLKEKQLAEERRNRPFIPRDEFDGTENEWISYYSDNKDEIYRAFKDEEANAPINKINEWQKEVLNETFSTDSFIRLADRNLIDSGTFARAWLKKDGRPLDTFVSEWEMDNEEAGGGMESFTIKDVVDFMLQYPDKNIRKTTGLQWELRRRYRDVFGESINNYQKETDNTPVQAKLEQFIKENNLQNDYFTLEDQLQTIEKHKDKLSENDYIAITKFINDEIAKSKQAGSEWYSDDAEWGVPEEAQEDESGFDEQDISGIEEYEQEPEPEVEEEQPEEVLNPEQQKIAEKIDSRIAELESDIKRFNKQREAKLSEISERNGLFGDNNETDPDNPLQGAFVVNQETINKALAPIDEKIAKAQKELDKLRKSRETSIKEAGFQQELIIPEVPKPAFLDDVLKQKREQAGNKKEDTPVNEEELPIDIDGLAKKQAAQLTFNEFSDKVRLQNYGNQTTGIIFDVDEIFRVNTLNSDKENSYTKLQLEKAHIQSMEYAVSKGEKIPGNVLDYYRSEDSEMVKHYGSVFALKNLEQNTKPETKKPVSSEKQDKPKLTEPDVPASVKEYVDNLFDKGFRLYGTILAKEDDFNVADLTNSPNQLVYAKYRDEQLERTTPRSKELTAYYEKNKPEIDTPQPPKKPKTSLSDKVKKGLKEDEVKRLEELRNKLRGKLGNLNAGLDPETFFYAAEATGLVIKSGVRQFADYAASMVDLIGEKIKPHLKALYEYTKRADSAEFIDEMTPTQEVDNANIDEILQQFGENDVNLDNQNNQDVSDRPGNSEQDSPQPEDEISDDAEDVSGDRGTGRNNGTGNKAGSNKRSRSKGRKGGSGLFALDFGEQGDNPISEREQGIEDDDAGNVDGRGNSIDSPEGLDVKPGGNNKGNKPVEKISGSFAERSAKKRIEQKKAESIPVKIGDIDNIRETLPFLLDEQQDDVLKAEKRFYDASHKTHAKANGKGILFTNGTGTGKTYTGLGIAKRFAKQGKTNILILTPSEPKVNDWANDGKNLGLNITPLPDTKTGGNGAVVTTYANFIANEELKKREFDLVIYDESHRLMESKKGDTSQRTITHYQISNKNQHSAEERLKSVHPVYKEHRRLQNEIRQELILMNNLDMMDEIYHERRAKVDKMEAREAELREQIEILNPQIAEQATKAVENTKVVFLSATPFKAHFNLRYANGILFDWGNETTYQQASRVMSRVDAESRFMLDNFGSAFEWKNHQLQNKSNADAAAIAMQEIEFAERLMTQGVVSGRAIESNMDYERAFPKITGLNSDMINQAVAEIYNYQANEFDGLRDVAREVFFNYNYTTQLLEALKTSASIPRMKKHIEMGRKVVVFHRRKQANVSPPFEMILTVTQSHAQSTLQNPESSQEQKDQAAVVLQQVELFRERYSELLEYEKTLNYNSAIEQIGREFGDRVAYLNGDVAKKDKSKAVQRFNDDNSGVDVIVIQEESGKEGISLHDTTGKHQRVLMSMSMPISSITALQIEGRIYRIGQESDAIFEYPLLGLDLEIMHFGMNINRKLSTTENLAAGEQARDLIRSFAEGVLSFSDAADPSPEQGKGGKEYDKRAQQQYSEFRRAVLVYKTNQKQRGRRDSREGIDYYPTPEPVGQKMVEWLGLKPNESGLEPSAGHGAISMWFPNHSKLTAIEPSYNLYSKLNARAGGGDRRILNETFEELDIINKYHGVAMNPPFGVGGKMAMDHLEKAFKHLKPYGRIVAIIPNGNSMLKRFEEFMYGTDKNGKQNNPDAHLVGEIILPPVAFEQAGTAIGTRIMLIDKLPQEKTESEIRTEVKAENGKNFLQRGSLMTPEEIEAEVARRIIDQTPNIYTKRVDLSHIDKVDELFDELEYIDFTPRMINPYENVEQQSPAPEEKPPFEVFEQKHGKTGETLYMVSPTKFLERAEYDRLSNLAELHDGYFSRFQSNAQNIRKGFAFKKEEDRNNFMSKISQPDIRLRNSNPLYSPTERALEQVKQEKGTPDQFKAMLLKNGAKQAELDWMGFDDFAAGKKGLTKAEVQDWINQNRIEVKEVVKGEERENPIIKKLNDRGIRVVQDPNENVFYWMSNRFELSAEEKFENIDLISELASTRVSDTKYHQYQLPGGENYREWLMVLPVVEELPIGITKKDGIYYDLTGKEVSQRFVNNIMPPQGYKSNHWEEPNILAHIRFNERKDSEGRRLLHVEEFQSDWAQKGKKEGFAVKPEDTSGLSYINYRESLHKKYGTDTVEELHLVATDKEYSTLAYLAKKEDVYGFANPVPDMPFKQTPQWVNLVLRRMASYAAENGYDGISWTPGEKQAERYDISKQVKSIDWGKNHDGTYDVQGDLIQGGYYTKRNLDANGIAEHFGKEISDKITSSTEKEGLIEGVDLKVGGEGMTSFYDKIVPAQANKIFGKFGSKVSTTKINAGNDINETTGEYIPDSELEVMYIPVTEKLFQTAIGEGFPMFQASTSNFLPDKIKSNNLKKYFNRLFANSKNAGTVHVVETVNEVPERFRQRATEMKGAQGFYIPNTGESYLITGNIRNAADAFKTWVHEVGVHKGLENIIPRHLLNPMFEKIYDDLGADVIQAGIPASYHEKSKSEQAEEYLAYLGEKITSEKELSQKEKGMWTKIVEAVKNILNKLFTGVKFTQTDAENIVRAAVQSVYQPPTPPKGTKPTDNRDVRFKVIGEQGAANLDKAQEATVRMDNLGVARQMETAGKTPKEIRLATGWEKGADGKWRYETDDLKLTKSIDEFYDLIGKDVDLSEIINDPELFKSYPELKDIKINFYDNSPTNTNARNQREGGSFDDETKVISIGLLNEADLKEASGRRDILRMGAATANDKVRTDPNSFVTSLLSHEIQHYIQNVEGFARGGNPQTVWERLIKDKLEQFKEEGIFQHLDKEGQRILSESHVREETGGQWGAYRQLAGEVESRNVQKRLDLTPQQRRETLLSETEDVAREDQLFLREALGSQNNEIGFRAEGNFLDNKVAGKATENYQVREAKLALKEKIQKIREFWQDINLPIRKLEEEIKKRGGRQNNKTKPYRDINLSFGRMEELYREFTDTKMKPILEAIGQIVKTGKISREDILPYIIAKHASERNQAMRMEEFDKWIESHKEATPEEREAHLDGLGKKDYSGVRNFDPENTYENPDELADLIATEIEEKLGNKELIDNLWKQINIASTETLNHWLKGGQISQKMYEKYKAQYKYFVPLRGWRHGAAKQLRYQKGEGFGKSLIHAQGRKSLADNPLAYMQSVAFKAIGERIDNEVRNSLLNLVLSNYKPEFKDLYHIKKVYYYKSEEYNPDTREVEEVWEARLDKPTEEMFENGKARAEFYGEHMKLRSKAHSVQHEVIVHREGGDVAIVFEGDQFPVAQAFNRQNTMFELFGHIQDAQHWNLIARTWPAHVTQFMKRMFTSSNPVFPFTNFFRDVPEAAITMFIQDGNPKVMANIGPAWMAVRRHIGLWGGKANQDKAIQKELLNFYRAGGATGFTHEKSPEQIEKELNRELQRILNSGGVVGKSATAVRGIFDGIQKWNQLFEDTTRFAVYLSSRQAGKSIEDAAIDAKEASVNFNRKGKGTKMFDSVWAFFGVAIQAAQKNFKLAKDHPGKFAAVAGSVAMAGFLEAMLNDLGDDDDEYYRLNEYVRHNYAVLRIPGLEKKYLRIPLPQFWRGFHSLGVISYDLMRSTLTGQPNKTEWDKAVANTTLNFIGGLSPIDIGGFWVDGEFSFAPIVPTFAKPFTEAFITNRDFMHSTISIEPFTKALEEQLAESDLHKKNVNPAIKAVTDFLSKDIGGKYSNLKVDVRDGKIKQLNWWLDWNPSKLEHLFTSYTGGTGKILTDAGTTIAQLAMPEQDLDINNIPFVNSFIRNVPEEKWAIVGEYYDLKDITKKVEAVKGSAKRNMDLKKYGEVSLTDLNRVSETLETYDSMISELVKNYGLDSDQGKQALELMEQAVKYANENLKD